MDNPGHPIYMILRLLLLLFLVIAVEYFNAARFSSDEHIKIIEIFIGAMIAVEGTVKMTKMILGSRAQKSQDDE